MFIVNGKLSDKSFVKTGVSENGAWKIIHFLIEKTRKRKPIKIPLVAKGKLAEKIESIALGEKIVVNFFIEGRKHNDRYFTNCVATEIDKYVRKSRYKYEYKDSDFEFNKDYNLFNENL
jgi:hypothetical protein